MCHYCMLHYCRLERVGKPTVLTSCAQAAWYQAYSRCVLLQEVPHGAVVSCTYTPLMNPACVAQHMYMHLHSSHERVLHHPAESTAYLH